MISNGETLREMLGILCEEATKLDIRLIDEKRINGEIVWVGEDFITVSSEREVRSWIPISSVVRIHPVKDPPPSRRIR